MNEAYIFNSPVWASYDNTAFNVEVTEVSSNESFPYTFNINKDDNAPVSNAIREAYKAGKIKPAPYTGPSKKDIMKAMIRAERNSILSSTDKYLMLPDYPITEADKQALLKYRQQLRDITKQPGFPHDVIWPEMPSSIK